MSRVVHFEIMSENPERTALFYREALGWKIEPFGESYLLVNTGPDTSMGINGGIMPRQFPQPIVNTVGVASLADTTARIEKYGGKKVMGPHEVPDVGLHAYFIDSEGNMFGVLQPAMPKRAAAKKKKPAAKKAKKK